MSSLHVVLPLPPSLNHLYFNHPKGGRRLSTAGEQYKNLAKAQISAETGVLSGPEWDPNARYRLEILLYFPELENAGWYEFHDHDESPVYLQGAQKGEPKRHTSGPLAGKLRTSFYKKGDRKAQTRWKAYDTGNFEKCIGDALKDLLGVDDRATFVVHLEKDEDRDNPRAVVWLKEIT